ncbi:urea ABC transporter substrate-binding protein [Phycisphaerales bacterium AB-hyl4]|uniref:Urea ABC transporter substrate-binding protein n=1 Tax=Natronomicrosphaera hydrolytica TaxID=3242702 RepID=A0ABV4U771_9BACT
MLLVTAAASPARADEEPIKVGILHSLTGTMAISETSLRDVALMTIDEINAEGGVLGRQLEAVVIDPASDWDLFAESARELLLDHEVDVVFGCWTSVSRKAVLPVFEQHNGLLFYPVQYEGEEQSPNIFYTGATPIQQLIPGAAYLMSEDGGGFEKFYLLGTDYVFPRTANAILRAYLISEGVPEENIREEYTPFGHADYQSIVGRIRELARDGNTAVLSTINGDSNVPFYREFANQGLDPFEVPIMAFSVSEEELRAMEAESLVGHLAAWNYFQSVDTPENEEFVQKFRDYAQANNLPGGSSRVVNDPMEGTYFGLKVYAAAVEAAGTTDVDAVREAVLGMEFDAPGGPKKMHAENMHTWKPVYIGEILADGQFEIIWESDGLVEPESFSSYLQDE